MMFSLPSPLTSPRTDDAVCVPDVDWDGAAALVGDWLPCGLPALPTDSPFGAIRVPELPLPNPFTFDPGADCPEGELSRRGRTDNLHIRTAGGRISCNCLLKTCPVPSPDR